jgi:FKBP-type peptidyl-prolyl cis-trans isomerase FklB
MKFTRVLFVTAIAVLTFASCKNFKGSANLKSDSDSASYYLGLSVGQSLKQFDLPSFNNEVFSKAVQEVLNNKDSKFDAQKVDNFLRNYFTKLQTQQGEKNQKAGEEFLAKNKTRSGVTTTASGLQYEVLKEGNGPMPKADDMVSVQYKGTLIDGSTFDSSYDRGQPAKFPVNQVIPAWTEVLQLMKVGSKYKIYVPSQLGYGANPRPGGKIKANMALVFEIELLSIDPKQAEAPKAELKKQIIKKK